MNSGCERPRWSTADLTVSINYGNMANSKLLVHRLAKASHLVLPKKYSTKGNAAAIDIKWRKTRSLRARFFIGNDALE